jgi:type II secretory pathway component PulK
MSPQRILGIVLVVAGVTVMIIGMNASHAASDQISKTFTGHFTDQTTWYIVGGLAAAVFGALLTLFGGSGRAA